MFCLEQIEQFFVLFARDGVLIDFVENVDHLFEVWTILSKTFVRNAEEFEFFSPFGDGLVEGMHAGVEEFVCLDDNLVFDGEALNLFAPGFYVPYTCVFDVKETFDVLNDGVLCIFRSKLAA